MVELNSGIWIIGIAFLELFLKVFQQMMRSHLFALKEMDLSMLLWELLRER